MTLLQGVNWILIKHFLQQFLFQSGWKLEISYTFKSNEIFRDLNMVSNDKMKWAIL